MLPFCKRQHEAIMKIIETRSAPNPRRVRIFLAEKGIAVPFEEMEFKAENLKSPEFTKLNRMQRVPVLVLDDGHTIAETVAICRYFEEINPEPALFGKGAIGRAEVEMWQRRMELSLLMPIAMAFRHSHPSMAGLEVPQIKEWADANKPRALDMLQILDEQLAQTAFVAGDHYSIADITGMIAIDFMRPARIARPESLTNVTRWYNAVASRPSAKA
jgi:glutathione S-transferase